MTVPSEEVNTWSQLSLLPPASRCITLTIELDPEVNSAHYDIEVRENASGDLVALHVMPMRNADAWPIDLQQIVDRLHQAVGELVDPF